MDKDVYRMRLITDTKRSRRSHPPDGDKQDSGILDICGRSTRKMEYNREGLSPIVGNTSMIVVIIMKPRMQDHRGNLMKFWEWWSERSNARVLKDK